MGQAIHLSIRKLYNLSSPAAGHSRATSEKVTVLHLPPPPAQSTGEQKRWVQFRLLPLWRCEMLRFPCFSRKRSVLELAIHQSGNAAAKAAAEDASGSGKEGSSAGILKAIPLQHHRPRACAVPLSELPGSAPCAAFVADVLAPLLAAHICGPQGALQISQ